MNQKNIKAKIEREIAWKTAQRILKEKEEIFWRKSQIEKQIQEEKKVIHFEKESRKNGVRLPAWLKKNFEENEKK